MRFQLLLLLLLGTSSLSAESSHPIVVRGRSEVTVTVVNVKLGDVADISAKQAGFDEAVIALKKIDLESAPAPGKTNQISASKILERLRLSGVDIQQIAYVLPQQIAITRAARVVTTDEIKDAIEKVLIKESSSLELSTISYRDNYFVVPGDLNLKATPVESTNGSRRRYALQATVNDVTFPRFEVNAEVNEWRDMPVASRSISRGSLVAGDDIQMARINIAALPNDSVHSSAEIIGYAVKQDLRSGEVFRRDRIAIPPLVKAGAVVTALYSSGLLEATTKAVALEDGIEGQQIRMRNDLSKRILIGVVRQSGLVEISK